MEQHIINKGVTMASKLCGALAIMHEAAPFIFPPISWAQFKGNNSRSIQADSQERK